MSFLLDRWRRIGARLYLALGFAVFLTLISGGTAVYYFEQSGNLNYDLESESVPALEASWTVAREVERLRTLGIGLMTGTESGSQDAVASSVDSSLQDLRAALDEAGRVPVLRPRAQAVNDSAQDLAEIIDNLSAIRAALNEVSVSAADHRLRLATVSAVEGESAAAVSVLQQMLQTNDRAALQTLWDEFSILYALGIDPEVQALGEGQGVYFIRGRQLDLEASFAELSADFDLSGAALESAVVGLLDAARSHSSETLGLAVSSFDEGRTLLTAISVISVIAAVLAAWLWVGNGMVRRLSRMSQRMRGMADGDLETPVPEVGRDEIGELAAALEVFRQQALEVQRLNLVEKLNEELRETNAELQRTQARLVAQEKLAALGELVSGVAHEISNPLNFVNNFSEGSLDLYKELSDMLENYRTQMSAEDSALFDDITQEMTGSLNRVLTNGGRALAIVERMRGLGVVGGDPVLTNINDVLRDAVHTGCRTFSAEWQDFTTRQDFDLDSSIPEMLLVEGDIGEAILNLVSNACFAMRSKLQTSDTDYEPVLSVSTERVGDQVEIRIRDNGPGMAEDVVGQIFNPFFSTRDGAYGAGLGLPIAADVARRFGGDLSVDTKFGGYAEFTMTLPMTAAAPQEEASVT